MTHAGNRKEAGAELIMPALLATSLGISAMKSIKGESVRRVLAAAAAKEKILKRRALIGAGTAVAAAGAGGYAVGASKEKEKRAMEFEGVQDIFEEFARRVGEQKGEMRAAELEGQMSAMGSKAMEMLSKHKGKVVGGAAAITLIPAILMGLGSRVARVVAGKKVKMASEMDPFTRGFLHELEKVAR